MPVLLETTEKSSGCQRAVKGIRFQVLSLPLHQEGRGGRGDGSHPPPCSRSCVPAKPVVNTRIQLPSPLAHSLIKLYGFALFPETSTQFNNNWRPTRLRLQKQHSMRSTQLRGGARHSKKPRSRRRCWIDLGRVISASGPQPPSRNKGT